jgi:hypothetical protein
MEHPIFPLSPRRLINLADMITKYFATDIAHSWHWLMSECWRTSETALGKDYKELNAEEKSQINGLLNLIHKVASELGMEKTLGRVEHFKGDLNNVSKVPNFHSVNSELMGLQTTYWPELKERNFVFIPMAYLPYFEIDDKFGPEVSKVFTDAIPEIKEAGNCLAAGLSTACVFLLMRVAELGLRKMAGDLGVTFSTPIEFKTWGAIIDKIEVELTILRNSPKSQIIDDKLKRYSDLKLNISAFEYLWRNPVMHTRDRYDMDQAKSAFTHVEAFMRDLT